MQLFARWGFLLNASCFQGIVFLNLVASISNHQKKYSSYKIFCEVEFLLADPLRNLNLPVDLVSPDFGGTKGDYLSCRDSIVLFVFRISART